MTSASATRLSAGGLDAAQLALGTAVAAASVGFSLALVRVSLTTLAIATALGLVAAWMSISRRYELTLAVLVLYLGLLDGYVKLKLNTSWATLGRDVLLYAIAIGALVRLAVTDRRIELPPLTGWVVAFVAAVLVQLLNPANGLTFGALASVRPHLEWVPLFFLGFAVMRSKRRLRAFLLLLLAVAAVNGVFSYVQFNLTPAEFAEWGPGYEERLLGTGDVSGRAYVDDTGTERTRPFALGADSGFGGILGVVAVPAAIALMLLHRRLLTAFVAVPLSAGMVVAVVTSQARVAIVSAVLAAIAFLVLASAARRILPTIAGLVLALGISSVTLSLITGGAERSLFRDYASVSPARVVETTTSYRSDNLALVPQYILEFPFGAGLGSGGPAAGYLISTGATPVARVDAETEFTYLLTELGLFGTLPLIGLNLVLFWLALTRTQRLPDPESRLLVAAVVAPLFALFATWVVGVATATTPSAPYFWFAAGVAAYWLGVVAVRPAPRSAFAGPPQPALPPEQTSPPPPARVPGEQALRIAIVYRESTDAIDGIRDASERLVAALQAAGHDARLELISRRRRGSALAGADLVVVQYNPFSWGRWGFAPLLVALMRRLRDGPDAPVVALMVHEPFMPLGDLKQTLMGIWQRLQLAALRRASDITFVSVEPWIERVRRWGPRDRPVEYLPVGSSLPDMRPHRVGARSSLGVGEDAFVVALFGTGHPSRRLAQAADSIRALAAEGVDPIVLNIGAGAPPLPSLPSRIRVESPGVLPAPELARLLSAADVLLAPFVDGVSTRRSTVMAALQHEVAVVGTLGPLTDETLREAEDSLVLIPVEAQAVFFRESVSWLARRAPARRRLATGGRRLYERHFDWPVIANRLVESVRAVDRARTRH